MSNEIKSLMTPKKKGPKLSSMFEDSTGGFSYTRVTGFIVLTIFLVLSTYLSFTKEEFVVPPKEWVYIVIVFGIGKPIQRFAEAKEVETQLNYEFQMAQIKPDKKLDNTGESP